MDSDGVTPQSSDGITVSTPGTYYWQAIYIGDPSNEPATSNCASEAIVVVAPLSITTTGLQSGVVGSRYRSALDATGGIPPYRWSLGSAPTWLRLNTQTGVVSGTPTKAGHFRFVVRATDQSSPPMSVAATLSITVAAFVGGGSPWRLIILLLVGLLVGIGVAVVMVVRTIRNRPAVTMAPTVRAVSHRGATGSVAVHNVGDALAVAVRVEPHLGDSTTTVEEHER
jgi:hypothetical protein